MQTSHDCSNDSRQHAFRLEALIAQDGYHCELKVLRCEKFVTEALSAQQAELEQQVSNLCYLWTGACGFFWPDRPCAAVQGFAHCICSWSQPTCTVTGNAQSCVAVPWKLMVVMYATWQTAMPGTFPCSMCSQCCYPLAAIVILVTSLMLAYTKCQRSGTASKGRRAAAGGGAVSNRIEASLGCSPCRAGCSTNARAKGSVGAD